MRRSEGDARRNGSAPTGGAPRGRLTTTRRQAIALLVTAGVLPSVVAGTATEAQASPTPGGLLPTPLRDVPASGVAYERLGRIAGRRHRFTFFRATWTADDGAPAAAVVRDHDLRHDGRWIAVTGPGHRLQEQWVVVRGDAAQLDSGSYYVTGEPLWLGLDGLSVLSPSSARLSTTVADVLDLTVEWDLSGEAPVASWSLTVHADDGYVVGYQAGRVHPEEHVTEVLCGSQQHARVIGAPTALKAWELFAPMALVESDDDARLTTGVFLPADVLEWEHERFIGPGDQPFAMSLRNEAWGVQPTIYAPPGGTRSRLSAGQSVGYAFGVAAAVGSLYDTQVALSRHEYGLDRYRRNVYDTSLTTTAHNILDLISIQPDGDDSVDYVPTVGGWWSRGKAFVNIESDQTVRTAVGSVALSANLLTSRPEDAARFWDQRARPMAENILSRRDIGYSPKPGFAGHHPTCGFLGDTNTVGPVAQLLRGQSGGAHELAMTTIRQKIAFQGRTPMNLPLAAYLHTGDEAWLAQAVEVGKWYAQRFIRTPYTTNVGTGAFGYTYVKAWLELFVLYEITGDEELLEAAHVEARRYMGLFEVRPIPEGTTTSPVGEPIDDMYYWWETTPGLPDYPRDVPVTETTENWVLSTTGLTFEQLSTYLKTPGGGFTLNPIWAPFLLRLAEATDDDFIRDMAHNMVIGRFTNYPGYYNRQFVSAPMRPEYPIEGPPGTSSIYFHHAPAQLGLTLDYLLSEHQTRSGGQIAFPSSFDVTFVYFRYRTYGAEPGRFYDDDEVWPYFPRGIVDVDNAQLNWLTAVSDGAFHLSLTNATGASQRARVTFDPELTGVDPRRRYTAEVRTDGGGVRTVPLVRGSLTVVVPGHGIVAATIRGAGVLQPWHRRPLGVDRSTVGYHFDDFDGSGSSYRDRVRGMTLPRPDQSGYDVYVQSSVEHTSTVTLRYRLGDGAWTDAPPKVHPYEWTIGVDDVTAPFTYEATVDGVARPQRTVRLPYAVSGRLPAGQAVGGDLQVPASTTPGDELVVTALVANQSGAPVTGVRVTAYARTGWTLEPLDPAATELADGETTSATFRVVSLPGTAPDTYDVTARVVWDGGGNQVLTPGKVTVFRATDVIDVSTDATQLPGPGAQATVSVTVMNRATHARSGTAALTLPAGWDAEWTTRDWTVPARSLETYDVLLTATSAPPGSATVRIDPGDGMAASTVRFTVGDPEDVVVGPTSPGYSELGAWLSSSLDGPDGSASRYTPENVHGGQAIWAPEITVPGTYEVFVWYPSNATTTRDALYEVTSASGVTEHHVDQQADAAQWRSLGTYELTPDTGASVVLTALTGQFTRAHSARFTRVA